MKQTNNQKLTSKTIHFSKTFPQEETPADTIEHENDQKVTTKSNIITGIDKDSRNDGNDVSTKASTESPKSGIYVLHMFSICCNINCYTIFDIMSLY